MSLETTTTLSSELSKELDAELERFLRGYKPTSRLIVRFATRRAAIQENPDPGILEWVVVRHNVRMGVLPLEFKGCFSLRDRLRVGRLRLNRSREAKAKPVMAKALADS